MVVAGQKSSYIDLNEIRNPDIDLPDSEKTRMNTNIFSVDFAEKNVQNLDLRFSMNKKFHFIWIHISNSPDQYIWTPLHTPHDYLPLYTTFSTKHDYFFHTYSDARFTPRSHPWLRFASSGPIRASPS
jgi:hypothetical protein